MGSLLAACSSEPLASVSAPRPEIPSACEVDEDCDDGLVCSGLERCLEGRCWSGRPPRCADNDPCTRDLCLEPLGCSYLPMCGKDAGAANDAAAAANADADAEADAAWRDAEAGAPDSGSRFSPRLPAYCDSASTIIGDVRASEQATLEQLAGVRCILGRLDVGGIAIRSLSSLSALRWVAGEVRIHDAPALQTFAGLDALERVEGPLSLINVGNAPSLEPLNALVDVAGPLVMSGAQTTRLGGFAALTHVGGELRLELPLQNLESAFPRLERVDGKLGLRSTALVTFDGFPALRQLEGDLELPSGVVALRGFRALRVLRGKLIVPKDITQLAAFDALENVQELELSLTKLRILDGFRALREASTLRISGPLLEAISGFDQLDTVSTLALGTAPKLSRLTAFGKLTKAHTLLVNQTSLTALPFAQLTSCDTLSLTANSELRDASTLVGVSNLSSLSMSGSSALRSLSVSVRPEMQTLALSANLALTDLSLHGLVRFVSGISIVANPNLSRCQVDQLAAKASSMQARDEFCCNQGCARCDGERCVATGSFDSGQSTRLSYLDIDVGTDLRAL
ncbi:MAG TPA: hypothetical protein VJU61_26430, partial [Polyangiaceae bacterium]|nr:hypothetical protein [Polyangiaceae bacterium]